MKLYRAASMCLIFAAWLGNTLPATAQTAEDNFATSNRCMTADFRAAHLEGKDMKFNMLLPLDYSSAAEKRFPVLYLLHGFSGDYTDWCTRTKLVEYAKPYEEIIIMPDANNSWYVNNYAQSKMQWEDYIIADLIPYVDAHYRTIASRDGRAIAGLSMGGYGALFLGLKHHEMFAAIASLSGVVASANIWRWDKHLLPSGRKKKKDSGIARALAADFGPQKNPTRLGEDPFLLIRKLAPAECPQLYLAIGWGDGLLHENREFVGLLSGLKMPYRYAEVPGKHEWKVWDEQIQRVLALEAPAIGARTRED